MPIINDTKELLDILTVKYCSVDSPWLFEG